MGYVKGLGLGRSRLGMANPLAVRHQLICNNVEAVQSRVGLVQDPCKGNQHYSDAYMGQEHAQPWCSASKRLVCLW